MSQDIEATVLTVINRLSNGDAPVELGTPLSSLGINSVKIMQIITQLELALDFELEEEHLSMAHFQTGQHIVRLLQDKYHDTTAA
ncbi:hypothetical protein GTA62_19375 [Roseobacter sp. HKCCD9010]|uniref:phosphopantetheine-binding protein n=1 Tax=unclassified Roseobacter TaxID=196798 RepID=UPI001492D0DD|nr:MULTISPECIES: phosphopantetheine-binding protein [unclassified Roseobacter]MBF9052148.1 hypothetical protein [Rhodobacterales bacterium HKCCD4356]NNV14103.1 hypothetical protein [Roseobacter sp. HKCCD7357]NNV18308.1 hypothetical protein [Roseobacter sp. HKCCD8768]NNV27767.1 hypothetical protein [Roseobacter sp. HKCCD8192]NNV32042.1 hypothetical protein [Roseobacter sp. HKCCD9061]